MAKAIVHIGFNKCGSSAIQTWLAENSGALAAQGIGYTKTDPRPRPHCTNPQFLVLAHSEAGVTMRPRPNAQMLGVVAGDRVSQDRVARAFEGDYVAWLKDTSHHTYVISSEHLGIGPESPGVAAALDQWTRRTIGPTGFVAYLRRPAAWIVSAFGHRMRKKLDDLSLDDFALRVSPIPMLSALRTWVKAVGSDRLDLRLFDEDWLHSDGLIPDFAQVVGADRSALAKGSQRINTSFRETAFPLGGLFRARPKRPRISPAVLDRVHAANAEGLDWVQRTFFPAQEARFRSWLHSETYA